MLNLGLTESRALSAPPVKIPFPPDHTQPGSDLEEGGCRFATENKETERKQSFETAFPLNVGYSVKLKPITRIHIITNIIYREIWGVDGRFFFAFGQHTLHFF